MSSLDTWADWIAWGQAGSYIALAVIHCMRKDYQLGVTSIFYAMSIVSLFILWRS